MLFLPGSVRRFHRAFLPVLAGVWFTVTLTGAIMPRYRVVLEPFLLLYFFAALEAAARGIARIRHSHSLSEEPPLPMDAPTVMIPPAP